MANDDNPKWIPLMLHRPHREIEGEFGHCLAMPGPWGGFTVMPYDCVAHERYPAFEFKAEIEGLTTNELRQFCKEAGGIPGVKTPKGAFIQSILAWQKETLSQLGFRQLTMRQLAEFYDWGKAIQRRQSYEFDRCRLIDSTGYMEISSAIANLSMFAETADRGLSQIFDVELSGGGWGGYSGKIITEAWTFGHHSKAIAWIEPPQHASREEFLVMAAKPELFSPLPDEYRTHSAAVYEVRKYQRVLMNALKALRGDFAFKDRWVIDLLTGEGGYVPEETITKWIHATEPGEEIRFLCSRRGEHGRDAVFDYRMPVQLAPLFLLAVCNHYLEAMQKVVKNGRSLIETIQDRELRIYEYSTDREALEMFLSWMTRLAAIAGYDEAILESFLAEPTSLSMLIAPELRKLSQIHGKASGI